jgi:hypothetical protein
MKALMAGDIPKPSTVREVDPKLEAIVMKALSPDAAERHATALELRQAIDLYLLETYPKVTLGDVRELMTSVFAEQQAQRARDIHAGMTAPLSEPPPLMPEGLEPIMSGISTSSVVIEKKGSIAWAIVGAIVTVLLFAAAGIGYLAWRGSRSEPVGTVASAASTTLPASVQIRVTVTPSDAHLTIDGRSVSGSPATLTVSKDDADHEIRATHDGYEPISRRVKFDSDLSLDISMTAVVPAPAPSATAKPAKWTSGASKASSKASGKGAGNCDPPFYFENGIKIYKPGCL